MARSHGPAKACYRGERPLTGICDACREARRAYRERNRAKCRAYDRAYYERNREKILDKKAVYNTTLARALTLIRDNANRRGGPY